MVGRPRRTGHLDGGRTGGSFALVEHPIEPRVLAAPMHTHRHENEYTYVLEGEIGVQIGDAVRVARPGDLVCKPRNVPHAFWSAGDAPARALEIISPQGSRSTFGRSHYYSHPRTKAQPTTIRSVPTWRSTGSR